MFCKRTWPSLPAYAWRHFFFRLKQSYWFWTSYEKPISIKVGYQRGRRRHKMGHALRKRVLRHMRLTKSQISQRIRAVWSRPSQSAHRIFRYYRLINGEQRPGWYLRMRRMMLICPFCACSKALFRMTCPMRQYSYKYFIFDGTLETINYFWLPLRY